MKTLNLLIQLSCLCCFFISLQPQSARAQANEITVPTNLPSTINTPISISQTNVSVELDLNYSRRFAIDVVLPVDGATVRLVDANGETLLTSGDPGVEVIPGNQVNPQRTVPGALYSFEPSATPAALPVFLEASFPPASEQTAMVTTVFVESQYHSGIALSATQYFVEDSVSLGFLLLKEGLPVTSADVALTVTETSTGKSFVVNALDNGVNGDATANDGIYSVDHTFGTAGQYLVEGIASFTDNSESITVSSNRELTVITPQVEVETLATQLMINSVANCVEGVKITADINALEAGNFIFYAGLVNNDEALLDKRIAVPLAAGRDTIVLSYTTNELKAFYAQPLRNINFAPLGILALKEDLVAAGAAKAPESIAVTQPLCNEPVEIGNLVSVQPVLSDKFIAQLNFTIEVTVSVAGNYQVSFKIVDVTGNDVQLLGEQKFLTAGVNAITFAIDSSAFLTADGPYQVLSGLVLGPAGSASKGSLGSGGNFNRWQFTAALEGDMDNDGILSAADRNILLSYRNQAASSPGDRRDLNGDGKIDLTDVRILTQWANRN